MSSITHLLPEKLVTALGWTLLHSLWQGALIALLAGVALILLKKHSAAVRYYVTLTALATVFLLAVVTFLGKYEAATERTGASAIVYAPAPTVTPAAGVTGDVLPASLREGFAGYFAGHFPLVVLLWATGVLVLLLRLVGGLAYAARMKSYQVTGADAQWQEKTARLAERLGLRRTARLLESGLAKVPMTIGYLKPVILLPLGALAGMAPAQVEAVLAHELAHIRQHDYLVNLVQSMLEILLFYHPAVWWLSARVREEREHCCDDLAVALCSDSMTFARALVHLEERYGQAPALVMAATGRNGVLVGRIKRLLAPGRRTPTFVEGFIVALVLLAGMGAVSVSAAARLHAPEINLNAPMTGKSLAPNWEPASAPPAERTAHHFQWSDSTDRRSDVIIVKDKKGNIVELYVDGRRIPDKQIANYRQRIDQALAEQKKNRYSDSPERDVNRAFRRMEEQNDDGSSWNVSGDLNVFPPLPPLPPMEPLPAIPPMEPLPPVPPVEPLPGMHFDEDLFDGHFFDDGDEDRPNELRDAMQNLEDDYQRQREEGKAQLEQLQRDFELNAEGDEDGKVRAELKQRQLDLRGRLENMEESYRRSRNSLNEQIDEAERRTKGVAKGRNRQRQNRQEVDLQRQAESLAEVDARSEAIWRGQTEQMKENVDHMREQAERMKEHTGRIMQEHAAQMQVHSERMQKHSDFMKALHAQLKADGFLKENVNLDFEMKNGQLFINEQVQPDEVYRKYRKLFEAQDKEVFSKEPGDKDFQLRFQYED